MKVLIAYAYAGIGHKKAAEAVGKALSEYKGIEVETVDILDYTNAFFKFSYPRMYLFLIDRAPFVWELFYYFLDFSFVDIFFAPLRKMLHRYNSRRFVRFIIDKKPDVVLSTHFFPSEVVGELKRKKIFSGMLITVVTDFLPHSFWMVRDSDYFIVAIDRTQRGLMRRGIKEERIRVFGIPADPIFGQSKGREALLKKMGIESGFLNLLIMSGGFGTGPIKKIIEMVETFADDLKRSIQLLIICGKNEKLFRELEGLKKVLKLKLHIFGYMDNVDEFMEMSDMIITKSGGLTVTEALSKRLPMIIVKPIPGQETRNCKVLTSFGIAVRANNLRDIKKYIESFIREPEKLIGMKARINLLSFPNAAKDIADFIARG